MEMTIKNLGRTVRGSVWDWPLWKITKEVQRIEPRLYFKWNPEKNEGRGIWELRIHPTKKTAVNQGWVGEALLFTVEYVENPLEHHIKDFEVINGRVIDWLHEHDTQKDKFWTQKLDEAYVSAIDSADKKNAENRKYIAKHYKKEFRQLLDLTQSGYDPMGWAYHKPKK